MIGSKIGLGKVCIINDLEYMNFFKEGEILVMDNIDLDWEFCMKKVSVVIINCGGRICYAVIVVREIGVLVIVGVSGVIDSFYIGMEIMVFCAEGEEGYVYVGIYEYEIERVEFFNM